MWLHCIQVEPPCPERDVETGIPAKRKGPRRLGTKANYLPVGVNGRRSKEWRQVGLREQQDSYYLSRGLLGIFLWQVAWVTV